MNTIEQSIHTHTDETQAEDRMSIEVPGCLWRE